MCTDELRRITIPFILAALILALTCAVQPAWASNGSLAAGIQDGGAKAGSTKFVSPDGLFEITGITAGTPTYDAATKTLTLDGVTAERVFFVGSGAITVRLVGENTTDICDRIYSTFYGASPTEGGKGSITIEGTGLLKGAISLKGSVTITSGTVMASGGSTPFYELAAMYFCYYGIECSGDFSVTGGTVNASATVKDTGIQSYATGISCRGDITVTGGSVMKSEGVECRGNLTITDVPMTELGFVKCGHSFTSSGSSVTTIGINCHDFTAVDSKVMSNLDTEVGSNNYGINCYGTFTASGSSVIASAGGYGIRSSGDLTAFNSQITATGIDCKVLAARGGSIQTTAKIASKYSCGIRCSDLRLTDGVKLSATGYTAIVIASDFSVTKELDLTGGVSCSGNLTLVSGTITKDVSCSKSFTMKSGTVGGNVSCEGSFTMKSGTVGGNVTCSGSFTMNTGVIKGGVTCKGSATVSSGSIGKGVSCTKRFAMKGGVVKGGVSCASFFMTKGSISGAGKAPAVSCTGAFTMKGGKITSKNADTGISIGNGKRKANKAIISGGKITCTSSSYYGMYLRNTNLTISGATVLVKKSYGHGIYMKYVRYRGKAYGGKIVVKKGSLTSTVHRAAKDASIRAYVMVNKPSCLKSIKGRLPEGAKFTVKGSTYQVVSKRQVKLVKRGGQASKPGSRVKYGGCSYRCVEG